MQTGREAGPRHLPLSGAVVECFGIPRLELTVNSNRKGEVWVSPMGVYTAQAICPEAGEL